MSDTRCPARATWPKGRVARCRSPQALVRPRGDQRALFVAGSVDRVLLLAAPDPGGSKVDRAGSKRGSDGGRCDEEAIDAEASRRDHGRLVGGARRVAAFGSCGRRGARGARPRRRAHHPRRQRGSGCLVAIQRARIDVAFLALHGRIGEDGCVQGLLELAHPVHGLERARERARDGQAQGEGAVPPAQRADAAVLHGRRAATISPTSKVSTARSASRSS